MRTILALLCLVATSLRAETFVLVLRPGVEPEPDLSAYHATKITNAAWGSTRTVVTMTPTDASLLRQHPRVRYLQELLQPAMSPATVRSIASQSLGRPEVTATPPSWSTGSYAYDGAGDVRATESESANVNHRYEYDAVRRLTKAGTEQAGSSVGTYASYFSYTYDGFGNRLSRDTQAHLQSTTPASPTTNRLSAMHYNDVGALDDDNIAAHYKYDAMGMATEIDVNAQLESFAIYATDDERVASCSGDKCKWTIRSATNRVVREYESDTLAHSASPSHWLWIEDYVYRNGDHALSAQHEERDGGRQFFHEDHLGSTRLVTGSGGQQIVNLDYEPYGMETLPLTYETQNLGFERNEPIRFTGHERDFAGPHYADNSDYLDYMHARYYGSNWGRFLSPDPAPSLEAATSNPQKWNRYLYADDNPLSSFDPDGRKARSVTIGIESTLASPANLVASGAELAVCDGGDMALVGTKAFGTGTFDASVAVKFGVSEKATAEEYNELAPTFGFGVPINETGQGVGVDFSMSGDHISDIHVVVALASTKVVTESPVNVHAGLESSTVLSSANLKQVVTSAAQSLNNLVDTVRTAVSPAAHPPKTDPTFVERLEQLFGRLIR